MEHSVLGLKPGSVLQDTYEIRSLLGEGGMGATFRGLNRASGHEVAIKVMTPSFAKNQKAVDLFRREANLLRTVRSDAVVRFETSMLDKDGRLFLVMEFVPGHPLAHYLKKGARLSSDDVLKLGLRLAEGLEAIHKLGIVHRDVAPDNVMISHEDINQAKFIDFGLASDSVGTDKSIIGDSFAGKLRYCAPEQLGLFGNKVSAATDAYALGLVLMRTAGLELPGEGKGFAAVEDRKVDVKITDPKVAPALKSVLEHLLKADPKDRPTDLPGLFHAALSGNTPAPAPAAAARKPAAAEEASGGNKLPLIAAGVVGLIAIAGGAWYFLSGAGASSAKVNESVEIAQEAVAADNPLTAARDLLAAGGAQNLDAALGALIAISNDQEISQQDRASANILIAEMYDPKTHSTVTSPFPRPDTSAARRYYQRAADLGSDPARDALDRLGE
ncbi:MULTISPECIES: serine/threonine-protein kinase [unclassified Ruegeria]|uniref:serine/threonine-protein kinase n=1 Tax=unclassified Ruegeria TaxID=2625375 RepID=UPI0014886377|nr:MULTISPECIES: serine/threonine-protein kinase [unclassified Ruegeria]NOD77904.1 protein kinase [Ruegeria sp. HKCCD4332]NOD88135.1 protein kinase [Ruegeria sp. HKCCD4318]NOE14983.1 protein kinase [Ruegeria sp. HKCCD4318-2]NOG11414.1 protein kinase [Ruegeria sp. HKCCD4315]